MHIEKIPFSEFQFEPTRSRGPGGQSVNRTSSAMILRWNIDRTTAFTEEEKIRIKSVLKNLISTDGDLLLRSDSFKDQDQNRKYCLEKLENFLQRALFIPKLRKKTRPSKSSIKRRLEGKSRRSEVKSLRRKPL